MRTSAASLLKNPMSSRSSIAAGCVREPEAETRRRRRSGRHHQRLQRVRAGHALAENAALKPELARITDPGALQGHRSARRLDRPRLIPIAVADALLAALISSAAKEVADLILGGLLFRRTPLRDWMERTVNRNTPDDIFNE